MKRYERKKDNQFLIWFDQKFQKLISMLVIVYNTKIDNQVLEVALSLVIWVEAKVIDIIILWSVEVYNLISIDVITI